MKRIFLGLSVLVAISQASYSQNDINNIIKGSPADANYLVNGYVAPALSVIGYGLNQGWYNTAKPHKVLGVDLTATINFIKVPNSALSYYVDNTKLNTVERLTGPGGNPQSDYAPTVFGPNQAPTYAFKAAPAITQFSGAAGADLSSVPVIKNSLPIPMAQIGLGLPKGFELKVRFIPTIKFGDNSSSNFGLFGIGLMHDVKQYIPGIKDLPFDLSGFVGYTKMTLNVAFDPTNNPDQKGVLTSSATTIQGVISKKFAVLTGYAGLGYNIANTKVAISGKYDLTGTGLAPPVEVPINLSAASNGPRATFGLRLKLTVFTLHGEYTIQKYSSLTLGFGISVR